MTPQFDLRALGGYQQMQPSGGPRQFPGYPGMAPQGGPQPYQPLGGMMPQGGPQFPVGLGNGQPPMFGSHPPQGINFGGGQMPWMGGPPQMIGHSPWQGFQGMGPGRGGIDLSQLMGPRRLNPMPMGAY